MKTFEEFVLEDAGSSDRGCIMHMLDSQMTNEIRAKQLTIDPEDLHENGIEDDVHITVLYGLLRDDPSAFIRAILDLKVDHKSWTETDPTYKLGKFSLFENEEFDVLKVDVESPDLHAMNTFFKSRFAYDKGYYPGYNPHVTVAYLKPGTGQKYVNDVHTVETLGANISTITYSGFKDSNGKRSHIMLDMHPFSMNMVTKKK